MITAFEKRPDDVLDYDIDFSRWLDGDTLVNVAATATGTAIIDSSSVDAVAAKIWISGGDAGTDTTITAQVETLSGRTKEIQFRMKVRT